MGYDMGAKHKRKPFVMRAWGYKRGRGAGSESSWLIGPNAFPRSAAKTELREVIDCHQFPGPEFPQTGMLSECCGGSGWFGAGWRI